MGKHDSPRLSRLHWEYLIVDEGHRLKNPDCKLNREMKRYKADHRLLLTGKLSYAACDEKVVAVAEPSTAHWMPCAAACL